MPFSLPTNNSGRESSLPNLPLVFDLLNMKQEQNIIESYSVTQTTLEQIFVRLADHDKDDNNTSTQVVSVSPCPASATGLNNEGWYFSFRNLVCVVLFDEKLD